MALDAARAYWRFTVLWLIVGCALGTLSAFTLLVPAAFDSHPVLSFGRLVSAHRAAIVHGALFSAVFAVSFTLLPRLGQASSGPRPLSTVLAWAGAAIVLIGVVGILGGRGSGEEYADLPPTLAFAFWLFLVAVALDLGFQLIRAKNLVPHPSQGLLLLAAFIPAVIYPFGLPDWLGVGLFAGLRSWITWRTLFLLCFAAGAIGTSLWMMGSRGVRGGGGQKIDLLRGPYVLGIALLVGFAPFTGVVHLLDAPLAGGLKAWGAFAGIGVAAGILLLVMVLWRKDASDPPCFLNMCGLAGLAVCSVQGVLMVIPPIHTTFHYTMNTSAHAHLALGAVMFLFLAGGLALTPRLAMRRLVGANYAMSASGLLVGGLVGVFLFQEFAGMIQAAAFAGALSASDWMPGVRWLQLGVAVGGLAAICGAGMIGWMVLGTLGSPLPGPKESPKEETEPEDALMEGGEG